jgi:plasmid replication initiation protein
MKNKLLIQDNVITTARYEMTALEKNILYAVMAQIEEHDPPTKYYKISTFDIADTKDMRVRQGYFQAALKKLLTREFIIKKPDGNTLQITVISSAEYDTEGCIEIGIDSKMRPYLFALKKNFTVFGLEVAISLKSKYAKRLYEMLCQFKSTGFFRITISELKERFQLINAEGVDQYERWSSFEKNVLLTAQTEINEKAEFQFDYHLKKRGRKIVAVEFIFRKPEATKPEPKPAMVIPVIAATPAPFVGRLNTDAYADPEAKKVYLRMLERLDEYGLSKQQIEHILAKHEDKRIHKVLYDLTEKKQTVQNTAAYLLKIFDV